MFRFDGKESRVYYDLALSLGLDLNLNKSYNHLSDSQRSDNTISAQNSQHFDHLVKTCVKTKFKRQVLVTNGFKDIDEHIPQWVSPIDVFKDNSIRNELIENKKRNNKALVAKQKKIAVLKTSYDSNEDQYKSRSRSMSKFAIK
jgi:hypothetical protein